MRGATYADDEGGLEDVRDDGEVTDAQVDASMLASLVACAVGRPRPVDARGRPGRLTITVEKCSDVAAPWLQDTRGPLLRAVRAAGRAGWVEVRVDEWVGQE
jgi:hypothetical protein